MRESRLLIVALVACLWFGGTWKLIETASKIRPVKEELDETRKKYELVRKLGLGRWDEYGNERYKVIQEAVESTKARLSGLYVWCVVCSLLIVAGFVLFLWPTRGEHPS